MIGVVIIDGDCATCDELAEEAEAFRNECPGAKRDCGHHCNCIWTQDACCWCDAHIDINGDLTKATAKHD